MTTLAPFRLSITKTASAAPATEGVLNFSWTDPAGPPQGGFRYDQESGRYPLLWNSLDQFDTWRQDQECASTVEL